MGTDKSDQRADKALKAYSQNFMMDTVISNQVYGERAQEALDAALVELKHLEAVLSRFKPDSDISRINSSAGICCEKVGQEAYEVTSKAVEYAGLGNGAFDITVGPLVGLWSDARKVGKPPKQSAIRKVLPLINYADIDLNKNNHTIGLRCRGQSLDLGGIGKGYAADRILEVYREYGITSAFTNLGGNVAAIGSNPEGMPWRVGISHPRKNEELAGVLSVRNRTVVTSGDYQRYFLDRKGRRYHHILDPKTGYPAAAGLVSVTVVADNSMLADALSTLIFVGGRDQGNQILKKYKGCEVILIDEDINIYVSDSLREDFRMAEGIKVHYI